MWDIAIQVANVSSVLLRENPNPTDQDIDDAMQEYLPVRHLSPGIRKAIHIAAAMQRKGNKNG